MPPTCHGRNATTTDKSDAACRRSQKATTTDKLDTVGCCDSNSSKMEELEVVSAVAEESEACCCAPDSLTMEGLDVMEVASVVEEDLEATCRLQLCYGQNAMEMDKLDAVCRPNPNSSTTEELDVASLVGEELKVGCRRCHCILNTTSTDKSNTVCCRGQKATTMDKSDAACCRAPNSSMMEELEVVSMVTEESEAYHSPALPTL